MIAATNNDALSLDQFGDELRRFSHPRPLATIPNPLEYVLGLVKENPALGSSRLLVRLLAALAGVAEAFRYAEVGSLDSATTSAVILLIQDHRAGATKTADWVLAAERAKGFLDHM